jgi:hypothetical protein
LSKPARALSRLAVHLHGVVGSAYLPKKERARLSLAAPVSIYRLALPSSCATKRARASGWSWWS